MSRNIKLGLASGAMLIPMLSMAATDSRPNVIMILVDDVGYGDYGCYGHPYHKTPNIDKLAEEGIKFTDFHSNGAVSSPTRAALMTGRYQQYSGIEGVITAASHREHGLPLGSETIASLLKGSGYKTAIFGKWHLGYPKEHNPIHFGFEEFVGYVSGNVDYFSHIDQEGYKDWWHNDELVEEEGYTTYLITEYAERYIKENSDSPFFLYLPYEATHGPWQGPNDKTMRTIVGGKYISQEDNDTPQESYTAMVETLDECVGRVWESVKEAGIEDNTLILLVSDNGGARLSRNAPLSGYKASLLEGGHRVAAMAYWRGKVEANQSSSATLATIDILPTICELTGSDYSTIAADGESFLGHITSGEQIPERILFWRVAASVAAREGDWKMIIDRKTGEQRLYNLAIDISESNNIVEQHPEVAARLKRAIDRWQENFKDIKQVA